jgi:hypothetical protein
MISELDLTECATAVFRRGEPTRKGHADGSHHKSSGCSITISDADFAEFEQQVADAMECLTNDRDLFESIRYFDGVDSLTLDFGVQRNRGWARFWHLSENLVRVAGELGVAIEISCYPWGDDPQSDQAEPPPKAT